MSGQSGFVPADARARRVLQTTGTPRPGTLAQAALMGRLVGRQLGSRGLAVVPDPQGSRAQRRAADRLTRRQKSRRKYTDGNP